MPGLDGTKVGVAPNGWFIRSGTANTKAPEVESRVSLSSRQQSQRDKNNVPLIVAPRAVAFGLFGFVESNFPGNPWVKLGGRPGGLNRRASSPNREYSLERAPSIAVDVRLPFPKMCVASCAVRLCSALS